MTFCNFTRIFEWKNKNRKIKQNKLAKGLFAYKGPTHSANECMEDNNIECKGLETEHHLTDTNSRNSYLNKT